MIQKRSTSLEGVFELQPFVFKDERGSFVKPFSEQQFLACGLPAHFEESFFSTSTQHTLRGMHFQTAPYETEKAVFVVHGEVLDVVLDLRKSSKTYGHYVTVSLSDSKQNGVFVPQGCAHGFLTVSSVATVLYYQTKAFHPSHDAGVHYASFGFDWPVKSPVVSQRDLGHPSFSDF